MSTTSSRRSARAAVSPPNPPPMIRIRLPAIRDRTPRYVAGQEVSTRQDPQEVALTPEGVAGFLRYERPVTFRQPLRTKALYGIILGIRVDPIPKHRAHVPSHQRIHHDRRRSEEHP